MTNERNPQHRKRLWLWGAVSFGCAPIAFWLMLPILNRIELLDVLMFFLLQPQGQLFVYLAGASKLGYSAMIAAVLTYTIIGGLAGVLISRTLPKHPAVALTIAFTSLQIVLIGVAMLLASLGQLRLT